VEIGRGELKMNRGGGGSQRNCNHPDELMKELRGERKRRNTITHGGGIFSYCPYVEEKWG